MHTAPLAQRDSVALGRRPLHCLRGRPISGGAVHSPLDPSRRARNAPRAQQPGFACLRAALVRYICVCV
eukprot:4872809-Prymnesium_polylepis.1